MLLMALPLLALPMLVLAVALLLMCRAWPQAMGGRERNVYVAVGAVAIVPLAMLFVLG